MNKKRIKYLVMDVDGTLTDGKIYMLGIVEIYQEIGNKCETLTKIISDFSDVAYIGDDINDLSCMIPVKKAGGIVGCPRDAVKKIIEIADYVADHKGVDGAVRDFIEWLVRS